MTLRSLERKLIMERTDIAVYDCVAEVVCTWQDALEQGAPLPHPIASAGALARAALCRPFDTKVLSYIDECHRKATLPDRDRLLRILLP